MRKQLVKRGRTFTEFHTGGQPQIWPPLDPDRANTHGRKTRLERMMNRPSSSDYSSSLSSDTSPEHQPLLGLGKRKRDSLSMHRKRPRLTSTPAKTTVSIPLGEVQGPPPPLILPPPQRTSTASAPSALCRRGPGTGSDLENTPTPDSSSPPTTRLPGSPLQCDRVYGSTPPKTLFSLADVGGDGETTPCGILR
ncbi:abl interactor homolog [Ostrea edulis]|uniref:abl interactor homolog n=1 Tax=Ostrea edulis TaxID=37623 RepID=UPI002095C15A|nr:abl interactor homolog [Ostrea edulis]